MRSCVVLLFASLLTLREAQGTIVTPVFVLKGRDLLLKLHADPPEKFTFVDWKINKTVDLVRIVQSTKSEVYGSFTGRVEFEKFSVRLKNVQEVDSGVYSAEAGTDTGDKLLTEYKVTVQGPVSPVELTVDRVDSSSSESCDLHVTCRTHNSHISSTVRCVDWVCSQEGGERPEVTTSGASLQVHLLNNIILCNHSNQVHWTQDLILAQQYCSPSTDSPSYRGWMITTWILIVIVVGLSIWLYNQRKGRISLLEIDTTDTNQEAALKEAALRFEKHLNERFASLEKKMKMRAEEKRRAAEALGPSNSSVPSDAEPTDP